jgi:hypothetical protein
MAATALPIMVVADDGYGNQHNRQPAQHQRKQLADFVLAAMETRSIGVLITGGARFPLRARFNAQPARDYTPFQQSKAALNHQREDCGRHRAQKNEPVIRQTYSGQDRLPIPAGTDQCSDRRRPDVYHCCGLDSGKNRRRC